MARIKLFQRLEKGLAVKSFVILSIIAVLAAIITYILYDYTRNLLIDRLRERIVAITSTAATKFDSEDIEYVIETENTESVQYERIVTELYEVVEANADVKYAYLMRRGDVPSVVKFVADAYGLLTEEELDENENGVLDPEEIVPLPGDPYPLDDAYPALGNEAFYFPTAEKNLSTDQWAQLLAGYAPIKDEDGNTIAVVGIDIVANDYLKIVQATFLPFLLFVLFLVCLLVLLTNLLVRSWNDRVSEVKELDKQKDELLSIVSHQLATPVSSVKWYLEMLLDGDVGALTKEQQDYLKTMQSVTRDLADLVSMILDVSRIQLGKMKVDRQDIDFNAFLQELLDVIVPKAKEKAQIFDVSIPEKLPRMKLDKRLTRMTLENILSNAIKYTPAKQKVIWKVEKLSNKILITVKDTGIGIPQKEQSKIFGKQYRASNTGSIEGNGFGLYVAKGAIESQDGKIWFESAEGKGTTFYVELPIEG